MSSVGVGEGGFFREASGRLVAALTRRFGVRHLDPIEDAVQVALAAAVETWPRAAVPDDRLAWLYRVAQNHLLGELRRSARRGALLTRSQEGRAPSFDEPSPTFLAGEVRDDLLRMLFACCDEALAVDAQLVLALKVLCGLDAREIAERLFLGEANVYKRLARARARLRDASFELAELSPAALASRLPAVRAVLYVLFTEGYLSSHPEGAVRTDLCDEAIRLTTELAHHPVSAVPETFALLALMHLQAARAPARQDDLGGLLLLDEQDRTRVRPQDVEQGLAWLARSAHGDTFTRYHAEAGIAAEHCLAPSYAETRWDRIVGCYELLDRIAPSPLHTLNRAVAVAEAEGPAAGLALLEGLAPPGWLVGSHLWAAVLADLHRRAGHDALADDHRANALALAPSASVRAVLARRLRAERAAATSGERATGSD